MKTKIIGITDACMRIGISPERLRYWELKGLITPGHNITRGNKILRRYSEEDIAIGIEIKKLIEEGFTLKGASQRLNRPYKGA